MKYITLGWDCSPATALRNLQLREYALPFDWIRSNAEILCKVIENNFEGFHEHLKVSENMQFIIDGYGLNYPHDYPTIKQTYVVTPDEIERDNILENDIVSDWEKHIPIIQEKYKRRIERFHSIMNSDEPVIALFSGEIHNIQVFKDTFKQKYNKVNISYVVLSEEIISDEEKRRLLDEENISLCDPEEILIDENNTMYINQMDQARLWYDAINKIHLKI